MNHRVFFLLLLTAGPVVAEAQAPTGVRLSVGAAYRFRSEYLGVSGEHGVDGIALTAEWGLRLSNRTALVVGVSGYWGGAVAAQLIQVPCLPDHACLPPHREHDSEVIGELYGVQVGVAGMLGRWRLSAGGLAGHAPGGSDRYGAGLFGALDVAPWSRAPRLTLGLGGQWLNPAPGNSRAILASRIGWRF